MDLLEPIVGAAGEIVVEVLGELVLEMCATAPARIFAADEPVGPASEGDAPHWAQSASWLPDDADDIENSPVSDVSGPFVWLRLVPPTSQRGKVRVSATRNLKLETGN